MNRLLVLILFLAPLCAQKPEDSQPRVVHPGSPGKAPSDAVVLFSGKDTSSWTTADGQPAKCVAGGDAMVCRSGVGDIYSKQKFRSAQIHLEFAPPSMPEFKSQLRGNSGVYIHGRYEIQILDSYENPTYPTGACGALYGQAPPLVNASRPPDEWQTYDIVFHAPQCGTDGTLKARGTLTVLHNGVLVQDHIAIKDTGKGCQADTIGQPGPLMLQDHSRFKGAPVTSMRFRNIWFRPLAD